MIKKNNQKAFEFIDEDKFSISGFYSSQENTKSNSEMKIEATNLLKVVPEISRKVFILHRYNEFKYKDIAEILNISIKTVEKHMSKVLKLLCENYGN